MKSAGSGGRGESLEFTAGGTLPGFWKLGILVKEILLKKNGAKRLEDKYKDTLKRISYTQYSGFNFS